MEAASFRIFSVVTQAYIFVGREAGYLLKAALLPLVAEAGCQLFVHFFRPEASFIEAYLWGLPATALTAWFVFVQTRLLLLNERVGHPSPQAAQRERMTAMRLFVLIYLLFSMGVTATQTMMLQVAQGAPGDAANPLLPIVAIGLLIFTLWGLRFGLLPLAAAVHHSLRATLQRLQGALVSWRLLGMGLVCILPLTLVNNLVFAIIVPDAKVKKLSDIAEKLTETQKVALLLSQVPLSLLMTSVVYAAAAYALREMLSGKRDA